MDGPQSGTCNSLYISSERSLNSRIHSRIVLFSGQLVHNSRSQPRLDPVSVTLLIADIAYTLRSISSTILFFSHKCHRPLVSLYTAEAVAVDLPTSSAPPFLTITPFSIICAASTVSASSIRVLCVIISNEPCTFFAVKTHALRHGADGIDIKSRIGLVKYGKLRLEHQHLQYLCLFLFAAGKAYV